MNFKKGDRVKYIRTDGSESDFYSDGIITDIIIKNHRTRGQTTKYTVKWDKPSNISNITFIFSTYASHLKHKNPIQLELFNEKI